MQLTAGFTIQAFEALTPEEKQIFEHFMRSRLQDIGKTAPVAKKQSVRLRPEHENLDLLRQEVIKANNIKITTTQNA